MARGSARRESRSQGRLALALKSNAQTAEFFDIVSGIATHVGAHVEGRLALLPKMLQSVEVLRLSSADLLEYVEQELAANEALESPPAAPDDTRAHAKHEMLQNVADPGGGLREHLLVQLAWRELSDELRQLVEIAISELDGRGLLPLEDEELAALVGRERIGEVLDVLRTLEPLGVGARSAIDAMLQQLPAHDPDFEQIEVLLREHLDSLARNRLPEVARAIDASLEELELLLDRMRRLDPRPGASFQEGAATPVVPDVLVERDGDDFRIVVDAARFPPLRLRDGHAALASDPGVDRALRSHLRGRLREARDVIAAVEMRHETLARVATAALGRQRGFLERGRAGLVPLSMTTIADELGLHNSTVSRAIAGKYVQTDYGVFPLRVLFDGARGAKSTARGGGGKGRTAIRHEIRALIADEDKRTPLSDDEIAARLARTGVSISRRTVAKYRRDLGIRSSWDRREHRIR